MQNEKTNIRRTIDMSIEFLSILSEEYLPEFQGLYNIIDDILSSLVDNDVVSDTFSETIQEFEYVLERLSIEPTKKESYYFDVVSKDKNLKENLEIYYRYISNI